MHKGAAEGGEEDAKMLVVKVAAERYSTAAIVRSPRQP